MENEDATYQSHKMLVLSTLSFIRSIISENKRFKKSSAEFTVDTNIAPDICFSLSLSGYHTRTDILNSTSTFLIVSWT